MWYRPLMLVAVLAAALAPVGAEPAPDRTVSVTLNDADVRQVVAHLLRGTDIGYVFADGVTGKVTAHLTNVPLRQALQVLLDAAGCEATEDEGALIIRRRPDPKPVVQEARLAPSDAQASAGDQAGQAVAGGGATAAGGAYADAPQPAAAQAAPADAGAAQPNVTYVLVPYTESQEAQQPVYDAPPVQQGRAFYTPVNPNLAGALAWLQETGGGVSRLSAYPFGRSAGSAPRSYWEYFGR